MGLDRRERPRGWGEGGTGCSPLSTAALPPRAPSASGWWGDTSPMCRRPSPGQRSPPAISPAHPSSTALTWL